MASTVAEFVSPFQYEDDPDHPGWMRWRGRDPSRFNAFIEPVLTRSEGDVARVRMFPEHRHSNFTGRLHGGALMGFIDIATFAGARTLGLLTSAHAMTVDLSTQFIGAGRLGEPLDALVEVLQETRRLMFLRGLLVQQDDRIASFSATIRKMDPRP